MHNRKSRIISQFIYGHHWVVVGFFRYNHIIIVNDGPIELSSDIFFTLLKVNYVGSIDLFFCSSELIIQHNDDDRQTVQKMLCNCYCSFVIWNEWMKEDCWLQISDVNNIVQLSKSFFVISTQFCPSKPDGWNDIFFFISIWIFFIPYMMIKWIKQHSTSPSQWWWWW